MSDISQLSRTPLFELHQSLGAKLVPFAGYAMPVQYPSGIIKEHLHTRERAGLFDVSHMGQVRVTGDGIAEKLERIIPVDLVSLAPGRQKYGLFLNDQGCILDDLMIQNLGDEFVLVVNAACKDQDFAHLQTTLGNELTFEMKDDYALLALQGPMAGEVFSRLANQDLTEMKFMDVREITIGGISTLTSRSGYTGEDGFEVSVPNDQAANLAQLFLHEAEVEAIGLGARDSLRLEAGLCLYGHDITDQTTPIEANLNWAISPARRINGSRAGQFLGAQTILEQMPKNVSRRLVGMRPEGRAPVREGVEIVDDNDQVIGHITSGGFGPSLGGPICLGYVPISESNPGTVLQAKVRNKTVPVTVTALPFAPHRYHR